MGPLIFTCTKWRVECDPSYNSTHCYLFISPSLSTSIFARAHIFMCTYMYIPAICAEENDARVYMHRIASRWCEMKYRCRLISNAENSGTAFRKFPAGGGGETFTNGWSRWLFGEYIGCGTETNSSRTRRGKPVFPGRVCVCVYLGKNFKSRSFPREIYSDRSVIVESFNVECYRDI